MKRYRVGVIFNARMAICSLHRDDIVNVQLFRCAFCAYNTAASLKIHEIRIV